MCWAWACRIRATSGLSVHYFFSAAVRCTGHGAQKPSQSLNSSSCGHVHHFCTIRVDYRRQVVQSSSRLRLEPSCSTTVSPTTRSVAGPSYQRIARLYRSNIPLVLLLLFFLLLLLLLRPSSPVPIVRLRARLSSSSASCGF